MVNSTSTNKPLSRIAIVGVGQVGGAAAYSLVQCSMADELLLVDNKTELRDAQVRDLTDVAYVSNSTTRVRAANYHEAGQCDVVVITAGSKHTRGETGIAAMHRNISIVRTVVNAMTPFRADTVLVVVANPVDLLTSIARQLSGLPAAQVLGSGTFLDSARLRGLLSDQIKVAAQSIDLYVVGVQGNAEVVAWSAATIGGVPIEEALPSDSKIDRTELATECRHQSQSIIEAKGATPLGMGSVVSSICSSILQDKRNVRPVSHFQEDFGCCISLPAVLGRKGVIRTIPMPLSTDEAERIAESAREEKSRLDAVVKDW